MKPLRYTLIALAAACGFANSETAYTTPVGYETLTTTPGFNYLGLRLHESDVVAGAVTEVGTNYVKDSSQTFALTTGTMYIVEFKNTGWIQIINGSAAVGSTITLPEDLSTAVPPVAVGSLYSIRKAATVLSIFGAVPELTKGFGGSAGADQIWVDNGAGDFNKYYYDEFGDGDPGGAEVPGWYRQNLDGTYDIVDPATIMLPYDEGFVFNTAAGADIVVTGTVKKEKTMLAFTGGFNYVGGLYPAGATLLTTYGAIPELVKGFGGSAGADQVWIDNGAGDFNKYYYDEFGDGDPGGAEVAGWYRQNLDGTYDIVDPATVSIPSGYVVNGAGSANVLANPPAFYGSL